VTKKGFHGCNAPAMSHAIGNDGNQESTEKRGYTNQTPKHNEAQRVTALRQSIHRFAE